MKFSEILFWLHILIFVGWFIPFFIPLSVWPSRIIFHFWYLVIQIISQLLMGFIMQNKIKKFKIICPLTTLMQKLRGHNCDNKLNFDHSFVREFAKRIKVHIPFGWVAISLYLIFTIVLIQYLIFIF